MENLYKAYFDGGSRGNPGPSAGAFVVYRVNEEGALREVYRHSAFIGGHITNNQAEYAALYNLLVWAKDCIPEGSALSIYGDSNLVIQQVSGKWGCHEADLKIRLKAVKDVESQCKFSIDYQWFGRKENSEADRLVNDELDRLAADHVMVPVAKSSVERHFQVVKALQELREWAKDVDVPLRRKDIIDKINAVLPED